MPPLRIRSLLGRLGALGALWLALYLSRGALDVGDRGATVLLYMPVYLAVAFVCVTGMRVGVSIARFPDVPHEAEALKADFARARKALASKGVAA